MTACPVTPLTTLLMDTILLFYGRPTSSAALSNLYNLRYVEEKKTGWSYHTGLYNNLRVNAYDTHVTITGSLPRFYFGSNLHTLTPAQVGEALEQISDSLHIPTERASVYRLDAGLNIIVDLAPSEYIRGFDSLTSHERDEYGRSRGVVFRNKARAVIAYDKLAEVVDHKHEVPSQFQGKNVLRCEVQLKRRVKKQVGWGVTGEDLRSSVLHGRLLDILEEYFGKIRFRRIPLLPPAPDMAEFANSRMLLGIESRGGLAEELRSLQQAYEAGLYDKRKRVYYNLRARLKLAYSSDRYSKALDSEGYFRTRFCDELAKQRLLLERPS